MKRISPTCALFILGLIIAFSSKATSQEKKNGKHPPVNVTYYLSDVNSKPETDAIRRALEKLQTVTAVTFGERDDYVTVQFDSHVVSYHQIAQAIDDAGKVSDKRYDPRLKVQIPEYAQADHAAQVDGIFAGKRLNQRVRIESADKTRGEFVIHFLPLQLDPAATGPQGFNGGHLHHPIHDPPPRGLGLEFQYVTPADPTRKTPAN